MPTDRQKVGEVHSVRSAVLPVQLASLLLPAADGIGFAGIASVVTSVASVEPSVETFAAAYGAASVVEASQHWKGFEALRPRHSCPYPVTDASYLAAAYHAAVEDR